MVQEVLYSLVLYCVTVVKIINTSYNPINTPEFTNIAEQLSLLHMEQQGACIQKSIKHNTIYTVHKILPTLTRGTSQLTKLNQATYTTIFKLKVQI